MKKYFHIPLALALILLGIWGCSHNRVRSLANCLPKGEWVSVACREQDLDMTPAELQELMADTIVSHRTRLSGFGRGRLTLAIEAGNGAYLVEIGEDGMISIADYNRLDKPRTFWYDAGGSLYRTLTGDPAVQPTGESAV